MLLQLAFVAVSHSSVASNCRVECAGRTNVTVSPDGRHGDCSSIQAAINCASASEEAPFSVLVLPGKYREQLTVNRSQLHIIGQSASAADQVLTWSVPGAAVLNISASDVVVANLTVFNDANAFSVGKNFALYVSAGDRTSVFYSQLFGAQDTVYTGLHRAYFWATRVNGSADFLYGQGSAVWDACTVLGEARQTGWSFLTAHSGNTTDPADAADPAPADNQGRNRSAYLIRNSRLPRPAGARAGATWLGRPWGLWATVVYESCWMDDHIAASGWSWPRWYAKCAETSTQCGNTYFGEYNSSGPRGPQPPNGTDSSSGGGGGGGSGGSGLSGGGRVRWSRQLTAAALQANWSVAAVLKGWTPPEPRTVWGEK